MASSTGSYTFRVVFRVMSQGGALKKKIELNKPNVIMYTSDSVHYKLAETFNLPLSDTTCIKDSSMELLRVPHLRGTESLIIFHGTADTKTGHRFLGAGAGGYRRHQPEPAGFALYRQTLLMPALLLLMHYSPTAPGKGLLMTGWSSPGSAMYC